MTTSPVVGQWYRRIDGTVLAVVAIDRDDGTVEAQHFDGTLEENELVGWHEQALLRAHAAEDWTGSVDVGPEDYGEQLDQQGGSQWADPLTQLDRADTPGYAD